MTKTQTQDSQALTVLRETIKPAQKGLMGSGLGPNNAWLADIYGYYPYGDGNVSHPLNLDEALKLSAVLICMDVLAQDIAKTPLRMRRRLKNGGSEVVEPEQHWLANLLATEPNRYHTWYEFKEMVILHLCAVQNAFIGKVQDMAGRPSELIPILPGRVRILVDETSDFYVYETQRLTSHERLMLRRLDPYLLEDEMIHIRGRMFDGLYGYSNLEAGSATMSLSKALQDYQTRLYKNDATLRGVFQMKNEETLSEDAFIRLKKQLSERFRNMSRSGDPLVLEEGMEFQSVSMTADQAEINEAQKNAIASTARLFRMPPHKIMHLDAVKYENLDTMERSYVQDTLVPIAERVEQRLARGLLNMNERASLYLEFDRESLMLNDIEKQTKAMDALAKNGAITINEMRQKRGMNPIKGGDVRLIPANYHLVDENNEIVLETQNNAPAPAGEDNNAGQAGKTIVPVQLEFTLAQAEERNLQ